MPAIPLCGPVAGGTKILSVAGLFLVINSNPSDNQVRLEGWVQGEAIVL
jgi:hypothetical protein